MLIAKTNLAMTSKHDLEIHTTRQLQLSVQPRAEEAFADILDRQLAAPPAELLAVQMPTETSAASAAKAKDSPFQAIMELLFGMPRQAANLPADAGETPTAQGLPRRRLQMVETEHRSESETCTFAASGNVCLADGSTRQFEVGYRMDRHEESTTTRVTELRDPLLLDRGEPGPALGERRVDFDLDADGKTESMRMPGANSALLFVDRNHNGRADDGSELFGPATGSGFGELSKLDADGNGWVDGGDAAYADLKLWQLDADGRSVVQTLSKAGIGALSTASEATPFTLKDDGATIGQVRSSGIWLGEHSGAGILRQVDVAVAPAEGTKTTEPKRTLAAADAAQASPA